jgi:signal transduction histidine kinase
MLVVASALAATVLLLWRVLNAEEARSVDRELEQEALELNESVRTTTILDGEAPSTFARRVLTDYLETNVPTRNESLLAVQDGVPFLQSSDPPGDVSSFVDIFGGVTEPAFFDLDTETGPARLLAQPIVEGDRQVGLLAITEFTAERTGQIELTIRNTLLVAAAALLVALALAWVVAGRILRPIGLLAETAREITEHDLTRRLPVQGADEIASLISSFNAMVDRLDAALASQREFLDDAGHELRTPITIMRGHLELAGDDPARLAECRPVVVGELDRMARIVDDMLLLARAEQVDFLRVHPVDVDELIVALMDKVNAISDHRWVVDEHPFGVVDADADRLTQAMLNLAVNAARHTDDGGEIGIGARLTDAEFTLWVRDTGEGIAEADQQRIFRRFARSTTQRPNGSAGLGLAISQAIVEAHGGSIAVASTPGHGATFTLHVPVTAPPTITEGDVRWPAS